MLNSNNVKILPLNNEDHDFIRMTEKASKNYTHSFHHICSVA